MSRIGLGLEQLRSPLARRLIVGIILVSSAITLAFTGIQLYGEYRGELTEIEEDIRQIEQVHLKSLSSSLWSTNQGDLQLHLDGIVRVPNLEYATVREGGKLWAQAGRRVSENVVERQFAMTHVHQGRTLALGTLTIVAGLDAIYRKLTVRAFVILASNALKTFLVAGFALAFFHWLVNRHLADIARHLHSLDLGKRASPLVLARAAKARPDELDEVVAATNFLQEKGYSTLALLHESEARFRALVQSAADGIFALDAQGIFRDANPQWCRMLGYAREELLAMSIGEIVVPGERDRVEAEILRLQAGGPTRCECEIRRKDGTRFPVELNASIMLEGRVLGIARDIAERKRTEQILALEHAVTRQFAELRDSAQAMRGAIRAICECEQWDSGRYYRWDAVAGQLCFGEGWGIPDSRIEHHIEVSRKVVYRPGEGLVGAAWQSRQPLWVPDVAKDPRIARPAAAQAAGIRVTLALPVFAGGAPIGVLVFHSRQAREPDEQLLGAIQVIALQFGQLVQRAIAEQAVRESEQTLRLITETIDEVFWMADAGLEKNLYVSPAYEQVWGRTCASLREKPDSFLDSMHPEDRDRVLRNLERQKSGQPLFHEYRIIRPDGTTRWIWDRGYPLRDGSGKVTRYAGVAQDITERKRALDEVVRQKVLLAAMSRRTVALQEEERRAIARELHDEIGQGLTAVKIHLQAMELACQGCELPFSTENLHEAVLTAGTILEQVRNLSLNLRPMQLDDLGLTVALRSLIERDRAVAGWSAHFDENLSAERLDADMELACYRVAQEALTNAMRHAGASEVWITLRRSDHALRLTVRDNGCAFDLASTGSTNGALHLGLLGMEERVKNMGGKFEIRTSAGEGTEVRASFPIVTAVADSAALA